MVRHIDAWNSLTDYVDPRSDYNYIRHADECVPVGPEPIPAGVCKNPDQMYKGSSGYRIIPGNTCDRTKGSKKDEQVEKKCSQGQSCLAWFFLACGAQA